MIKRFIFTILLLLLNVAGIAVLLSDPFNLEKLFISGFFIFLLVFYVISWTVVWQNILHSNYYQLVVTIFAIIFVTFTFVALSFELYRALSTGEINSFSKFSRILLDQHDDPWLFWITFSMYLGFIISVIGMGVGYWIKKSKE